MKVCPRCEFPNDECFPTCVRCNALMLDVPSTPDANPDSPEHEQRNLIRQRHARTARQLRSAGILYALTITLTAMFPGFVQNPGTLGLYFAGSSVVAFAVARGIAGQFSSSFFQVLVTVPLVLIFGPLQVFTFLMLITHVTLAPVLWHWMEMIHGANR